MGRSRRTWIGREDFPPGGVTDGQLLFTIDAGRRLRALPPNSPPSCPAMPDGVEIDEPCFRRLINLGFDVTSQPSLRPGQLGFVTAQEQISSFVRRDGAATGDFTAFGFPKIPSPQLQIG